MKLRFKNCMHLVGMVAGLSACSASPLIDQAFGWHPESGSSHGAMLATSTEATQQTQIIVPADKDVAAAINEAMPTIKKVLPIHACLIDSEGLRKMNFYAVPGVDMAAGHVNAYNPLVGLPIGFTQYHDKNKCLAIQMLDHWSKPALNALAFRAVYFADDSGETVSFLYLFKKVDDGSWKIAEFLKSNLN